MHPFEKFEEMYNEVRSKKGHGGFIDVILALLPVILPLIQDCFKTNSVNPRAVRRRLFNRARIASGLMKTQAGLTWKDAFDAADDCFDVADAASDADVQEFIECCK